MNIRGHYGLTLESEDCDSDITGLLAALLDSKSFIF